MTRRTFGVLYAVKGILAFCSIVYELLLAQALSAFLANTVLRYSVTIGLYLFSLGIGAWCAERRWYKDGVRVLMGVELLVTLIGGFSIVGLYLVGSSAVSSLALSVTAHTLIIVIGVLTGLELPLLMELRQRDQPGSEEVMLAWDYAGAVAGTLMFAFFFYSRLGLVSSAFCVGALNAAAGMLLISQQWRVGGARQGQVRFLFGLQALLCLVMLICLYKGPVISRYLMRLYVS